MWEMNSSWYESVIKGTTVYFILFIIIKIVKKKKIGDLAPFEFALLLTITGIVISTITNGDKSIPAAVIFICTLSFLNILTHEFTYRYRWFEELIDGQARVVILNGKIHKNVLKREKITNAELLVALREHEVMNPNEVKCAILEVDGKISVTKYAH